MVSLRLHTSVSYGGGFVNKIKREIGGFCSLVEKLFIFICEKYTFSKSREGKE